jgi:hypothetical protein
MSNNPKYFDSIGYIVTEVKEIFNAGLIVQFIGNEDEWREFQELIKQRVNRLVYVKRVPAPIKLEISEETTRGIAQ